MAIEGSLDDFRLPDILQMVAQQQKTGILTIQGDATIVAVSFLAGRVVAADSLEETVEQRLGEVLLRQGHLSRGDLATVSERERRGEGRLIDLLVDSGHVEREQVLASMRQQTEELLVGLLEWRQGEFKFYGNDEVSYEEGFQPISVEALLLATLDEGSGDETGATAPGFEATGFEAADFELAGFDSPTFAGAGDAPPARRPAVRFDAPLAPSAAGASILDSELSLPPTAARPRPAGAFAGGRLADAVVPLCGLLLAVLLVLGVALSPSRFLLPLPWQQGERTAHHAVERQASYQTIDRAAKTYFLLEGRFPDDLASLQELSMLDADDLRDPAGVPLVYRPQEDSYELAPDLAQTGGTGTEALASTEAITGNFLLDPEFLSAGPTNGQAPLVLLD